MSLAEIELIFRAAAETPRVLSFAGGLPAPGSFPRELLAHAAEDAILSMGTGPLQYDWPEGRHQLRALIAAALRARGADVEADDVVVTNGAQDAIAIATDVLSPRTVQVDRYTYSGALEIFRSRGCSVTTEHAGLRYAMPALGNPSGLPASDAERQDILSAAWVLEDEAYAQLDFRGDPAPPLIATSRRNVFHIGTFSKVLSPGLRVGWIVPPRAWLGRVRGAKMRRDLHACGLAQTIVERVLLSHELDSRRELLRACYARRRDRMVAALRLVPGLRYAIPVGGFSIWVETDLSVEDGEALHLALDENVMFDPGCLFRAVPRPDDRLALRLSYSSIAEQHIGDGIERLARVLQRVERARHAA